MRLPTFWRVFSATILAITGVAACLQPNSITCPDGVVCPTGTVCVATRIPLERCVFPAQVDACADLADLAACAALPNGRCYDGVCLPGGCGNGYVDTAQSELVAEQCDDGNTIPNDSCSADCRSNETCGNGVVDLGRGEQCDDRDRLGHDGCSSDCRTESLQLTSAPSTGPMGRSHVAFAYDLARDRVVMFGGRTVFEPTAETWEWDGATWIERHPRIAPPARTDASMVYDTAHHRMILFGGQAIDSFDDTWSWDGIAWTALDPPIHPSKRHDHAMAYDAARHRVVLFGGAALPDSMTGGDDQTWAFDGTTWSPLPVTGPSPRAGHAMAYDPHRDVIVLVGGGPGVGPPETWELDTAGWHDRSNGSNAPNGLDDLTLAFDPQSQRLLTVGLDRSTYGWDGVTWSKVTTTGAPSARRGVA
ncbi:MAG: hypothetical protein NT062_06340, partial [Proteobacteria bacterium]|nr:hypothetical protein [Pseudomonadota bacterium]